MLKKYLRILKITFKYFLLKLGLIKKVQREDLQSYWKDRFAKDFNSQTIAEKGYNPTLNKILTETISQLNQKKLLEIGAGFGLRSKVVAQNVQFDQLTITEYSPDGLKLCQENLSTLNEQIKEKIVYMSNIDAFNLSFDTNTYDLIYQSGVFMCFKNPKAALKEYLRVAKKAVIFIEADINDYTLLQRMQEEATQHIYIHDYQKMIRQLMNELNLKLSIKKTRLPIDRPLSLYVIQKH